MEQINRIRPDEEAFRQAVEQYREGLIFFLNRFVRNFSEAEELAEDTFVALLLHPHKQQGASLKTYLFTIGRNKALNYLKKQSRHPTVSLDDAQNLSDGVALEGRLLREERDRQLNAALESLHEDYRTVLHLLYFEELTLEEAGKVMKKNKKQMQNLAFRAKNAAKAALEREGFRYEK